MVRDRIVKWLAITAVVFGVVTIVSGGRALFGSAEAQGSVGDAIPFVLWFNFLAGFVYILVGTGLLMHRHWAVFGALFLAASTILVFAAFGLHIAGGGAFEMRTVAAMTIRSLFWIATAVFSMRAMKKNRL
jgi:hypothetical protein